MRLIVSIVSLWHFRFSILMSSGHLIYLEFTRIVPLLSISSSSFFYPFNLRNLRSRSRMLTRMNSSFGLSAGGDSHKSCISATLRGLLYIFLHQRLPTGRKEPVTQTLPLRSAYFKKPSRRRHCRLPLPPLHSIKLVCI